MLPLSRRVCKALTGLNQEVRGLYRDENVFEDVDLQMAGYAAALRVLTRYVIIDGRDMTAEAIRPRRFVISVRVVHTEGAYHGPRADSPTIPLHC